MRRNEEPRGVHTAQDVAEFLNSVRPPLHGSAEESPRSLGIRPDVLRYLADTVQPGWRTLETGCGQSTIVLATGGADHTVVSPLAAEHERIRRFCETQGISLERVKFVAGDSRLVLPSLDVDVVLDMVLVDGCHAFPSPFIDWFYSARRLRAGGLLVVDDVHIATGRILHEFLAAEAGRWELVEAFRRTSVFRKLVTQVTDGFRWREQPFCGRTERFRRLTRRLAPLYKKIFRRENSRLPDP